MGPNSWFLKPSDILKVPNFCFVQIANDRYDIKSIAFLELSLTQIAIGDSNHATELALIDGLAGITIVIVLAIFNFHKDDLIKFAV